MKRCALLIACLVFAVFLLQSCAGSSFHKSTLATYDETMTFEGFSSIPLRSRKADLEDRFRGFKTEVDRSEFPGVSFWILRNPETGFQKAALTFERMTQTLIAKLWLVSDTEPERALEVAKSRFKFAHFSMIDLPSENPHLLFGPRILTDEKSGISMEVNRSSNKVSSISWDDPSIRQPAYIQTTPKPRYSF